ncbi:MAG: hypothetical protein WC712_02350 [Candidatus Brocadiia bacterium]
MKNLIYANVFLAVAAAVLCCWSGSSYAETAGNDKIVLVDGKVETGRVTAEGWEKVITAQKTYTRAQVARILHFDTPMDFTEALDMIDSQAYDNAKFKLQLALEAPDVRDWIKVYVAYYLAEIEWQQRNFDAARTQYDKLNADFRDNFFLRDALWRSAQTFVFQEKYEKAEVAFKAIYDDKRFDSDTLKWRAGFSSYHTYEIRGQFRDAYQKYLDLAQRASQTISREAMDAIIKDKPLPVAEAETVNFYFAALFRGNVCQALAGKAKEANDAFDEMAKKPDKRRKNLGNIGKLIVKVIELDAMDKLDAAAADALDKVTFDLARAFIFYADSKDLCADILYWSAKASLVAGDKLQAAAFLNLLKENYEGSWVYLTALSVLSSLSAKE